MKSFVKISKLLFFITVICLIMSTIVGFIMLQSLHSHECSDSGCDICVAINNIKESLESFAAVGQALLCTALCIYVLRKAPCENHCAVFSDLVSLKVKL